MVKDIIQIGNPLLRDVSKKISFNEINSLQISKLKVNLLETLRAQPIGVAISAVQIGEPVRLFVVEIKTISNRPELKAEPPRYFFNAEIIKFSSQTVGMYEGCLSIVNANLFGNVVRPKSITLKYLDESGESKEETFDGFMARVIQHEVDHLNGKLFTDTVETETLADLKEYRKQNKNHKR